MSQLILSPIVKTTAIVVITACIRHIGKAWRTILPKRIKQKLWEIECTKSLPHLVVVLWTKDYNSMCATKRFRGILSVPSRQMGP